MKININNKLDLNALNKAIFEFECVSGESAYLMMNKETMDALTVQIGFPPETTGLLCSYAGNKVFKNNDLKFGEVEIR